MEPAVISRATDKPRATIPKDKRLRAVYRRELQNSVYYSALVAMAGIVLALVGDALISPPTALAYALAVLPLGVTCLAIARLVRRRARRYVIPLGMVVGLTPIFAIMLSVLLVNDSREFALAALGMMPLAFAIFIPLERHAFLEWLALADLMLGGILVAMILSGGDRELPAAAFGASALGSVLGLCSNDIQVRRKRQLNSQIISVRGLYGRMKEHEQDLRRQDEFLFMQQETLVVQQAELLRLNEELENIARLDALTGLGNRLRLNEDLAALAARIERNGGTAGLLLLDLDRFKRLNDSMGHLAGDAALRGVAESLRKTSRVGDGVYRYGGEEFLVILHNCDQAALRAAGQRYLTAIQAVGMLHPDNPPYGLVTASAGATELSQANCADVDVALRDADQALYVAKERGRNRLEIHAQVQPSGVVEINRRRVAS